MRDANKGLRARYKTNSQTGCWEWTASCSPKGYGQIEHDGRNLRAHRLAYATWVGPIPSEMFVLHHCDNPPCINPDHLWLGTNRDNLQDAARKGRMERGEARSNSKLKAQDIPVIFAMRAAGMNQHEIATHFPVDPATISCILARKRWKHINIPEEAS